MSDTKELLERARARFTPPEGVMDSLIRRRARKQRNQRIGVAAVAVVLTLVTFVALVRAFRIAPRPANEPTPTPSGIFSHVGGWIAYGNNNVRPSPGHPVGVWAVDPMSNFPQARIRLSELPGRPLAWSRDGSKLLIWRVAETGDVEEPSPQSLVVLNADGAETPVITSTARPPWRSIQRAGSFSPDGSRVIVAVSRGIYSIDLAGGAPSLIRAAERRSFPASSGEGRTLRAQFYGAAMSPDGTQIAYLDGRGIPGGYVDNSLRVMNADGSDVRVLFDTKAGDQCPKNFLGPPAWSPDGTHLAFRCGNGLLEVGADGSGLTRIITRKGADIGSPPDWSPDGTRIAFTYNWGVLGIADADGSHLLQLSGNALSVAWNPLPESVPRINRRGTGSVVPPLVLVIALLGVVGGGALLRRVHTKDAPKDVGS